MAVRHKTGLDHIADEIGMDTDELRRYRYQPRRGEQPVYAVDNTYYSWGNKPPPDDEEYPWVKWRSAGGKWIWRKVV